MREYDHLSTGDLLDAALAEAHRDLSDENDELYQCMWTLAERATREVFDAAAAWCGSDSTAERTLGASILSDFGDWVAAMERYRLESLEVLRPLLTDDRPSVIAAAMPAFNCHGSDDDSRRIIRHMDHPMAEVRQGVARALPCGRDSPEEVEALIRLSGDEDWFVRSVATSSLGEQCAADSSRIRNALLVRLGDSDGQVRCSAITVLAKRGDRRVLGPLVAELYTDPVVTSNIEAAAELGAPELLPALMRIHEEYVPDEWTDEAIRNCGGEPPDD